MDIQVQSREPSPRPAVTVSDLLPTDEVTQAYRAGLAWQYHRAQELGDRLEQQLDELEELKQAFLLILGRFSGALLEKSLSEQFEEDERKRKRRKRLRSSGFDARKAFSK